MAFKALFSYHLLLKKKKKSAFYASNIQIIHRIVAISVSNVLRKLWRDNCPFLLAADLSRIKKRSLTQRVPTLDVTTRVPLLTEHKRALFAPLLKSEPPARAWEPAGLLLGPPWRERTPCLDKRQGQLWGLVHEWRGNLTLHRLISSLLSAAQYFLITSRKLLLQRTLSKWIWTGGAVRS